MSDRQTYPLIAWGDESVRVSAPTPSYLLAATVLPEVYNLSQLVKMKPKGALKLHWRDLTDKHRRDALIEVAKIDAQTTIVVASPLPRKKQERGRRRCLEMLLPQLETFGVSSLVLESRVLQLNANDIEMLDAMRSKNAINLIGIEHAYAYNQPNLWIPDLILGAYGDSLCGNLHHIWKEPWEEIFSKCSILETHI